MCPEPVIGTASVYFFRECAIVNVHPICHLIIGAVVLGGPVPLNGFQGDQIGAFSKPAFGPKALLTAAGLNTVNATGTLSIEPFCR